MVVIVQAEPDGFEMLSVWQQLTTVSSCRGCRLLVVTLSRAEAAPAAAVFGCGSRWASWEERVSAERRECVVYQDLVQPVLLLERSAEEVCEVGQRIRERGAAISAGDVVLWPTSGRDGRYARHHSYPLEVVAVGVLLVKGLLGLLGLGRRLLLLLFEKVGGYFHCPQTCSHVWEAMSSCLDLKLLKRKETRQD